MAKLQSGTRIYGTATIDTQLIISGTAAASNTVTGALQVAGGAGIGKDLQVGGDIYSDGQKIVPLNITVAMAVALGS